MTEVIRHVVGAALEWSLIAGAVVVLGGGTALLR